jgi:Trypsin-like peptidase domain
MRNAITAAAVCLTMLPASAGARQLRIEREKVLATVGQVLPENIELVPALPGPGRVLTQAVSKGATSTLRLHFTITQQPVEPSWHMEIVTRAGARQSYRPRPADTEFWSAEIPGSSATVELFTTAANVPLKLIIDRAIVSQAPVKPRSISPDGNQLEPYRGQAEPIRTLGRSVVRLRFVDDDQKKVFTCTGFLVFTSAHILTNEHCINTDTEMRSALVDFDFDGGGAAMRTVRLGKLLATDPVLDFSLLELAEPADRAVLTLKATGAVDGRPLLIVQHPGGEVKQVSVRGCKVKGTQVSGTTAALTDFGHLCDTLGGSSGSPVFDPAGFTVVGLHHFGFFEGDPTPVNQAVRIGLILDAIRQKFPALTGPATE